MRQLSQSGVKSGDWSPHNNSCLYLFAIALKIIGHIFW